MMIYDKTCIYTNVYIYIYIYILSKSINLILENPMESHGNLSFSSIAIFSYIMLYYPIISYMFIQSYPILSYIIPMAKNEDWHRSITYEDVCFRRSNLDPAGPAKVVP